MKFWIVLLVLINSIEFLPAQADSSFRIKYKNVYTADQLKKEKKDIKEVTALIKDWKKSIKKNNPNYLSSLLENIKLRFVQENNQTSERIAARNRLLSGKKNTAQNKDSIYQQDFPKVYNPDIPLQVKNTTKEQVQEKRSESEILSTYGAIFKRQKKILIKLANIREIQAETTRASLEEIHRDFIAFLSTMKDELNLMKKESRKR
ncbi:MAG: hypothetical protein M3Q56_00200 [Bacteroidota bacterium]|nr:hypothetical protein [Bacteroidota bacterium]